MKNFPRFALGFLLIVSALLMGSSRVQGQSPNPLIRSYPDDFNDSVSSIPVISQAVRDALSQQIPVSGSQLLSPAPEMLETYTRVVYESWIDDNWEIYYNLQMNMDDVVRLTNNSAPDYSPNFNRAANKIVFTTERGGNVDLYSLSLSNGVQTRLTSNAAEDYAAKWSPDGTKILFVSTRDGNGEIYVMNADGSGLQRVTFDSRADFSPTWNPDGTQIAWIRVQDSTHGAAMIGTIGGSSHQVTGSIRYMHHLDWSPTGTRFSFGMDANGDGWYDMAICLSDGSGLQVLVYGQYNYDYYPGAWSTGERYLFGTAVEYIYYYGNWYIYSSFVSTYRLSNGEWSAIQNSLPYDMHPSAASRDPYPPSSYILPAPELTKCSYDSSLTLNVAASDQGISGLDTCSFEYSFSPSGPWNYMSGFDCSFAQFYCDPSMYGQTAYFRSRAIDLAENEEPWPAVPDAHTTIYHKEIQGHILDVRNRPIPFSILAYNPPPLLVSSEPKFGYYHVFTVDSPWTTGNFQEILASSPYFGSQLPSLVPSYNDQDQTWNIYLPHSNNLLLNGGFETGDFTGWAAAGNFLYAVEQYQGHSGEYAALFSPTLYVDNWLRVSQSVSVPVDFYRTTLGYTYFYDIYNEPGYIVSPVYIEIDPEMGATQTFTDTGFYQEWRHAWVDLTPWAGQQITVTFGLTQTGDEMVGYLYLDEMSIDEWYTPVISNLLPSPGVPGEPFTMTILGENFIMTPTVRLNDIVMTDVLMLDEHTLQITFPEGLPVGFYDVWVINPGGQRAVRQFISGTPLYLPVISTQP